MRRQSRQNRRQRQRTPAETIKGRTDSGNPGTNGLFEPDRKTPGSAGLGGGHCRDRTCDPHLVKAACPVKFDSDRMEWHFDAQVLDLPCPNANPITAKICRQACDTVLTEHPRGKCSSVVTLTFVSRATFFENLGSG